MKLIDLSQPLFDACPNCPAHPAVHISLLSTHETPAPEGESWHLEHLAFASHTGSHVDAPLHKLPAGKSLDDLPLDAWTGPALILDLRGIAPKTPITAAAVAPRLPIDLSNLWILLATGFGDKRAKSQEWLHDAPFLAHDAARLLVDRNARGVAIDHWSIGDATTHTILLSKPVLIVEDLHFPPEVFSLPQPLDFMALPLNLRAHSGGPCRPVLIVR